MVFTDLLLDHPSFLHFLFDDFAKPYGSSITGQIEEITSWIDDTDFTNIIKNVYPESIIGKMIIENLKKILKDAKAFNNMINTAITKIKTVARIESIAMIAPCVFPSVKEINIFHNTPTILVTSKLASQGRKPD